MLLESHTCGATRPGFEWKMEAVLFLSVIQFRYRRHKKNVRACQSPGRELISLTYSGVSQTGFHGWEHHVMSVLSDLPRKVPHRAWLYCHKLLLLHYTCLEIQLLNCCVSGWSRPAESKEGSRKWGCLQEGSAMPEAGRLACWTGLGTSRFLFIR